MRKRNYSKRVLVGAAALTMLFAGSAFTASNSMPADNSGSIGYGATTVTGVTVSNIAYKADTTDGSKLASVVVKSTDANAAGTTGTLTLKDGSTTPVILTTQDCGTASSDGAASPTYTYTCTLAEKQSTADVKTVGFTATGDSAA